MTQEEIDAEEIFQRIQRTMLQVEAEDEASEEIEEEPEQGQEEPSQISGKSKDEDGKEIMDESTQNSVKIETEIKKSNGLGVDIPQAKKPQKEYKFTEVSTGNKQDIRRFSQSKQFTGIQKITTNGPLLKCQDISSYKPDTGKLDEILLRIKKNNDRKLELLNANQVI
jgi:hypothetical protein